MSNQVSYEIMSSQVEIKLTHGKSGDPDLEEKMIAIFQECFDLWCERHRKYGCLNISKFGELGCLVRASDKLERLVNLLFNNRGKDAQDEPVEDSWLDMVNYAAMALLCRRGHWPTS